MDNHTEKFRKMWLQVVYLISALSARTRQACCSVCKGQVIRSGGGYAVPVSSHRSGILGQFSGSGARVGLVPLTKAATAVGSGRSLPKAGIEVAHCLHTVMTVAAIPPEATQLTKPLKAGVLCCTENSTRLWWHHFVVRV